MRVVVFHGEYVLILYFDIVVAMMCQFLYERSYDFNPDGSLSKYRFVQSSFFLAVNHLSDLL